MRYLRALRGVRVEIESKTHPVDTVLVRRERRLRASKRWPEQVYLILPIVHLNRMRLVEQDFPHLCPCDFWEKVVGVGLRGGASRQGGKNLFIEGAVNS